MKIDEEEAKFQAEKRKIAIERAKTLLYYQTDRVKQLNVSNGSNVVVDTFYLEVFIGCPGAFRGAEGERCSIVVQEKTTRLV